MPTENRSSNTEQISVLQREDRYILIKRSDLEKLTYTEQRVFGAQCRKLHEKMFKAGAPARSFLVIEGDWPEFEPTWAAIEARVTGKPTHDNRQLIEAMAQAIYEQWAGHPGFRPRVPGGNSEQQGNARMIVRRTLARLES